MIPDRIEAGTFLVAGAITGGELLLHALRAAAPGRRDRKADGVRRRNSLRRHTASLRVRAREETRRRRRDYRGISRLRYRHAGAVHGAGHAGGRRLANHAKQFSRIAILHASEMMRMGANIAIDGNLAVVTGPTPLSGAPVTASDLARERWTGARGAGRETTPR